MYLTCNGIKMRDILVVELMTNIIKMANIKNRCEDSWLLYKEISYRAI